MVIRVYHVTGDVGHLLTIPKENRPVSSPQLGIEVGRASSCVTTVDHVQHTDAQLNREHPEQHKQRLPVQESIPSEPISGGHATQRSDVRG